jgi:hypothetical protein
MSPPKPEIPEYTHEPKPESKPIPLPALPGSERAMPSFPDYPQFPEYPPYPPPFKNEKPAPVPEEPVYVQELPEEPEFMEAEEPELIKVEEPDFDIPELIEAEEFEIPEFEAEELVILDEEIPEDVLQIEPVLSGDIEQIEEPDLLQENETLEVNSEILAVVELLNCLKELVKALPEKERESFFNGDIQFSLNSVIDSLKNMAIIKELPVNNSAFGAPDGTPNGANTGEGTDGS